MDVTFALAGFLVGFTVGLTGVGGGSLMTPILVVFFGIKPIVAVGTDLLYAALTKGSGIWVHHRNGSVDWRVVGLLATGSLPTSIATIFLMRWLSAQGYEFDALITRTLGFALVLTSLVLLTRGSLSTLVRKPQFHSVREVHRRVRDPLTVVAGVILGALVTISSVGAGAIGAAMLFFLHPSMRAVKVVGTDIAHAVPLTAIAGIGHLSLGSVDFMLLANLLIGSFPGIYLGSKAGLNLPEKLLRMLLAAMLLTIGVRFAL